MCGRYSITVAPDQLAAHFSAELPVEGSLNSRQNAAPSEGLPVLLNEGERRLQILRWGLVPRWADDPAIGNKMINARAETIEEKASFRDAFKKRRCLVLADGFYEWQKLSGGKKQPVRFALKSGEPFAFAGLWETWRTPDGQILRTFTIITTTPNDLVAPVHDRMPVILSREAEKYWLDNATTPERWRAALVSYPAELMTSSQISGDLLRKGA